MLAEIGEGYAGLLDDAAAKGFMGDDAHLRLFTGLNQRFVSRAAQGVERELQRLIKPALYRLFGYTKTVTGKTNMADIAFFLIRQRGVQRRCAVVVGIALRRIVQLEQVDAVGFQRARLFSICADAS